MTLLARHSWPGFVSTVRDFGSRLHQISTFQSLWWQLIRVEKICIAHVLKGRQRFDNAVNFLQLDCSDCLACILATWICKHSQDLSSEAFLTFCSISGVFSSGNSSIESLNWFPSFPTVQYLFFHLLFILEKDTSVKFVKLLKSGRISDLTDDELIHRETYSKDSNSKKTQQLRIFSFGRRKDHTVCEDVWASNCHQLCWTHQILRR